MSFKQTTQKTKTKTSKFQPIALDTKEEKKKKTRQPNSQSPQEKVEIRT